MVYRLDQQPGNEFNMECRQAHLLYKSNDKGEGGQAHGSHSQAEQLLHQAVVALWKLLRKHDLQDLHDTQPARVRLCTFAWWPCLSLTSQSDTHMNTHRYDDSPALGSRHMTSACDFQG